MRIATIEWVDLHQRCDNSCSLSAVVHVEDTVLPNELPSIDGVLCRNDNVGVDRIDDMTPTFGNVSTGRIRLFTKTPWPNNSELVLADDLLDLGIVLEEVTGLYVSRIVRKVLDLVSAACGETRGARMVKNIEIARTLFRIWWYSRQVPPASNTSTGLC